MKRLVRPLILTACFMTGAFIHGFLSVNYLGLSYIFSLALGAALWGFRRPNAPAEARRDSGVVLQPVVRNSESEKGATQ